MEWILKSPQIHSAFTSLGCTRGDVYHVNENCIGTLEDILKNILSEDRCLRPYRRTISFGQNVPKDLMPVLIHAKDDAVIGIVIKILMNLTIPVECLLALDVTTKTDFGRHTIFELRNLLTACKNAFVDPRAIKAVIDYMKKNSDNKHQTKLTMKQCEHIHDCLTLMRNVLHITDEVPQRHHARDHSSPVHNQILWNLFSQGLDKLVIKLMTIPEAANWSATMVQLIALLYKDQHVGKLQKLLNVWLETSLSESSEDNESNTSPQNRGSSSTSPIMTTDQTTSDSSDNSAKVKDESDVKNEGANNIEGAMKPTASDSTGPSSDNSMDTSEGDNNKNSDYASQNDTSADSQDDKINEKALVKAEKASEAAVDNSNEAKKSTSNKRSIVEWEGNSGEKTSQQSCSPPPTKMSKVHIKLTSETSDCGYGTQIENRESISTSSNEDDRTATKPVHVKPRNPKHKANTKVRISNNYKTLEDTRRRKMVKRGKSNILNVKGLHYHQPTDDDIALVLKEFTVDFMLKGYSSLVRTLHKQILNYDEVEIDRCHFFWLVTYFLKFVTQMELDLVHVESVLSFDVVSFLTAEGVNLCEQFEIAVKYNKADLNIWRRKLHLVVTAIREFVQAIDTYKKIWIPSLEAHDPLLQLQMNMWETEELRSLMILLIRSYNSDYHDKQYLQDLVVTNHLLLLFLDNVIKMPCYTGKVTLVDHIRQFATPHMMWQYGVLLEDFETNGEFVNDCVFTIMHHVGGDAESLQSLYRANILHAFSSIKQSDYEICDHWTDLVEYVMNSFARLGSKLTVHSATRLPITPASPSEHDAIIASKSSSVASNGWSDDELSALGWNYMQSKNCVDVIGKVVQFYKDEGVLKSRKSVIDELYHQNLIDREQHEGFLSNERTEQNFDSDIRSICEELAQLGYSDMLEWVQSVLLEVCYAKICLAKIATERENGAGADERMSAQLICKKFGHVLSSVIYHNIILNKTISLVPWNCRQSSTCKEPKFVELLSKLDLYMPLDSGMMFFRIPQMWTPETLYELALKISNIDTSKLKFSISDITGGGAAALNAACMVEACTYTAIEVSRKMPVLPIPEHCYRIQRFKQIGAMVQYTPTPDLAVDIDSSDPPSSPDHPTKVDWLALIKKSQESKIPMMPSSYDSDLQGCGYNAKPVETTPASLEAKSKNVEIKSEMKAPEPGAPYRTKMERSASEIPPIIEEDSMCDTASVASDFSRMYVSDEDERLESTDERRFCFHDLLCDSAQTYVHVHDAVTAHVADSSSSADACFGSHPAAVDHEWTGTNWLVSREDAQPSASRHPLAPPVTATM